MAIKSFVKIKPIKDDGAYSGTFNQIRKGINRTGTTVTSISHNQVETEKLIRFERDWLRTTSNSEVKADQLEEKQDLTVFQKWRKGFVNMFKFEQRNKKEDKEEKKPTKAKQANPMKEKARETAMGFFEMLGNFLTPIFDIFVTMAVFKWLSNPEKAKNAAKVFKLVFAIGKFAFKILGFGVSQIAKGITNIFGAGSQTGIAKAFAPLTGLLQLFSGFLTLRYLLNPLKLFSDGTKVKNLFRDTSMKELTWEQNEQWRKFGYKDTETGKIYTEKEYKAQKKSVERQQKKLRAQGRDDQARKVGNKFNQRVKNPTRLQTGKNVGKKLMQPNMQKGIAAVGGITRAMSGIAMGEDATEAVGAGLGQAAGGMIGSALLTPFLGPFGPIVGNALGGFLGEWVGKTFLPVIKPIFEPIKMFFTMAWDLVKGVADETGLTEFLGTLFNFLGQIGKVMFEVIGWIMKPITWLLGGVIKVLGGIISFIIGAAKNIFAFMRNPIGFAWKIIRGKDPGKDVKLEEMSQGGEVKRKHQLPLYLLGGLFKRKEKWKIINEIHTPNAIRKIEYENENVPKNKRHTKKILFDGNTYPEYTAEQIIRGEHQKEASKEVAKEGKEKREGSRRGWKGVLGGIADTLTGGIFDFDGRGNNALQNVQQLPLKIAGMAAKGVLGAGKAIAGGIGKLGKGLWGGVKGLFGRKKKEEIKPIPELTDHQKYKPNIASDDKIQAMVDKQNEMHAKFQWKKEKDATLEDVIAPPRTMVLKTRVPVINNIAVGTKSRVVTTVPSPMFTC